MELSIPVWRINYFIDINKYFLIIWIENILNINY